MSDQAVKVEVEWPRWTDTLPEDPPVEPRSLLRYVPRNPFCYGLVMQRLKEVRAFTLLQCRDAMELNKSGQVHLQASVQRAIRKRIGRLEGNAANVG